MKINAKFVERVVVHSSAMEWVDSPMPGVKRRPLDRVGVEVARATSVVRYAPGSHFSSHVHTGGEEFLVLEGVFQDEHGDFPAGSYIRNPPQSSHTPGSTVGCVILVKLWQFRPEDRIHVRLNSNYMKAVPHRDLPGVSITPLYHDKYERVEIQDWEPNTEVRFEAPGGMEVFVLAGGFIENGEHLREESWLRMPVDSSFVAKSGEKGARIWIKHGHLLHVEEEIELLAANQS